jgi:calcineurin-like phosphoesterase family protein
MQARQQIRVLATLWLLLGAFAGAQEKPPATNNSLKFAIIGDSGTGSASQYRVAEKLVASRSTFPYEFVLMMGDNLYGTDSPSAYDKKFERPYKALLDGGIKFYASLGNHDDPNQRFYKSFNMNGERYYTFKPKGNIRIFALDSNYVDKAQLDWFEKQLTASGSDWKIVFFHHPIYSSGGAHGSDEMLRAKLEPLFLKYGVDAVFQGHEHFYERIKPQKGIYYFISGGAAKLREGNVSARSELTAKAFDTGYHFMLIEIAKDNLNFQAISDQGKVIDSGSLPRFNDEQKKAFAGEAALPKPTATAGRR